MKKKIFRAELKRCGIKVIENFDKILTKYYLSESELKLIDLTKISIFKNIIRNRISYGVKMLLNNQEMIWNRNEI